MAKKRKKIEEPFTEAKKKKKEITKTEQNAVKTAGCFLVLWHRRKTGASKKENEAVSIVSPDIEL